MCVCGICGSVLCVINICKPREYPELLRSYVTRKKDIIKKKKKGKRRRPDCDYDI